MFAGMTHIIYGTHMQFNDYYLLLAALRSIWAVRDVEKEDGWTPTSGPLHVR